MLIIRSFSMVQCRQMGILEETIVALMLQVIVMRMSGDMAHGVLCRDPLDLGPDHHSIHNLAFHTCTVPSMPPLAMYLPLGDHATACTAGPVPAECLV